ncbi:calcium and integrin-binding family member 2-like [Biomphalaria glabrata]|uniref:Calcium and integrin-binding family member 2-like n=1 Tax=Biomphalaria glabrata TaxID=6526 RepID=A0A9W3AVI5_BIOGL|nr:calcium and integrin-binding family member 2-like [Biomphalaria glabrata]XP_055891200.1 calcium and integrin-binding family member 2-like [Biomphalaria glabrata]XP_055891208.1 calcium and integrin-binding family member 2-like [Biomphalaria glabrata]KAI8770098.1 calcium and integrin-binding family member 3 [Biomphalaria glabrata]KAI8774814.1 calcium and integrin-binding family member 3 [Biomphalaria glabrata]
MGNKESSFSEAQLEAYQDCTFFTRTDILRVFDRFRGLAPDQVPYNMSYNESSMVKIPLDVLENMPELKENPFRRRICQVFSDDGTGDMAFDDFLDMFSVFSEAAPREIKSAYAFKIYDFDGDNFLGRSDLETTLKALTQNSLKTEEVKFVLDQVLEETDLDSDGMLSYIEFEHVISRAPDFLTTFHIRI